MERMRTQSTTPTTPVTPAHRELGCTLVPTSSTISICSRKWVIPWCGIRPPPSSSCRKKYPFRYNSTPQILENHFVFSQLTTTCKLREKNNHPASTAVFQQLYTWVKNPISTCSCSTSSDNIIQVMQAPICCMLLFNDICWNHPCILCTKYDYKGDLNGYA